MNPEGYSGTPLPRKLGIREGHSIAVRHPPPNHRALLQPLPPNVTVADVDSSDLKVVHVFVRERKGLKRLLPSPRSRIKPDGVICISWLKKASGILTDMTEGVVREAALVTGLEDVKAAAIDETWSGLKLVIPVRDRT